MPIYEYVCQDCDTKFEKLRPVSQSDENATCPECQSEAERVLSVFACCMSTDESGIPSSIGGGSSCASCASGSCSSCAM